MKIIFFNKIKEKTDEITTSSLKIVGDKITTDDATISGIVDFAIVPEDFEGETYEEIKAADKRADYEEMDSETLYELVLVDLYEQGLI